MHILSSILLAFSSSIDSLIIGIAYGVKQIRIKFIIPPCVAAPAWTESLAWELPYVVGEALKKDKKIRWTHHFSYSLQLKSMLEL